MDAGCMLNSRLSLSVYSTNTEYFTVNGDGVMLISAWEAKKTAQSYIGAHNAKVLIKCKLIRSR